jgi:hypothetical protein
VYSSPIGRKPTAIFYDFGGEPQAELSVAVLSKLKMRCKDIKGGSEVASMVEKALLGDETMSNLEHSLETANRIPIVFVLAIVLSILIGAFSGIIGTVRASDGTLSPPHSDRSVDTDVPSDGLYNLLIVNVSIDVTAGGIFYVTGELRDNMGANLIENQLTVAGLSIGLQVVKLKFTGYLIRASGYLGPYQVGIGIFDDTFNLLDTGTHMTNGYSPFEFQTLPAGFSPPHSDFTIDSDSDMLDDYLITSVNVNADIPGPYMIEATLFDNTGMFPITSGNNQTFIPAGPHTIDVAFIGYTIRLSGFDGPYRVELRLYDDASNLLETDMHFTSPYFSGNFEPSPAAFLPPHSDIGLDPNSNTVYEYLVITAYVAVFVEGNYVVSGASPFGMIENQTYLATGIQPVDLYYIGFEILNSGADGPYVIDLELRDEFYNILDVDPHNTGAYLAKDFEPKPPGIFEPPHHDYGLNTDADMKFNYLVVMANITVDAPGYYDIRGELYDSMSMTQITYTANSSWMGAGKNTVYLLFDGTTIHLSRVNGPYGVYITLFDAFDYFLDFDIFSTRPYSYNDFDMPPATFTPPHADYGLDTDIPPDSSFNFLVVNASIRVKDAGWYLLYGTLLDSSFDPITQAQGFSNLTSGPNSMLLEFNGLNISRSGVNGPYVVSMDLYYFEGQLPIHVDWDMYFTARYNYTDFMAPSPATIWGYVYDATDSSPVDMAQISVMNYTYGWISQAETNSTGYYELEAFDGDFCVLMDASNLQSNISLTSVVSSTEATRYLEESIPNQMDSDITFLNWDYVGYGSVAEVRTDNRSIRFMIDILVGDRNGYVDQDELDLFATFLAGSEATVPSNTMNHLLVDGIHYDLVPGSELIQVDALGPVVSPNPSYMVMSANFTSNATIPVSTIHWLEWNVTYDNNEEGSTQYGQMPSGYTLWGYLPVNNVSVSGLGLQSIVMDPLGDWNTSDNYDNAWINLTVGQGPPDSQAPQVVNALINGLPSPTYGLANIPPVVYLNATVDDAGRGSVPIGGANYTVGAQNWGSSTSMDPIDGYFDSSSEDVTVMIVPQPVTTMYCVYGWDILLNGDTTGLCSTITIVDNMAPGIQNIQFSSSTFFLSSAPPTTTLTATVDETSSGSSMIAGANYTVSTSDSWPGTLMIAVDGAFDETAEDVAANVPLPSSSGVFDYFVHAWDVNPVYNDSAPSVQITIIDDVGPGIFGLQLNGQSAPSAQAGTPVLIDATIDDSGGRGDTSIQGANYTVDGNWVTSTALFPADGTYDSVSEDVIVTIDTDGWSDDTYQICVYGWDSSPNYNVTGACDSLTVYSVDDQPPITSNARLDGSAVITVSPGSLVNLTARIYDTGGMSSNILSANYSIDMVWIGTDMFPTDGNFDSTDEMVYGVVDTAGWTDATYQICVHGSDVMPNHNISFSACADLTVQTQPDSQGPTMTNETAEPSIQTPDDFVRISANVYDNVQVNSVAVRVTNPDGNLVGNYTMNYDSFNSEYYYSHSFIDTGTYDYTIWASDPSGNWNSVAGDFRIEALASPSFLDDFWWVLVIVVTAILVGLMMVWKTKPSESSDEPGEEVSLKDGPDHSPEVGKEHVHEFAVKHGAEHESVVKCLTCGDTVLLVGDTDLLKTRCDHCGSTLLEIATGYNYLIVDEDPGVAFQGFKSILKKEVPGLCISTTFPQKLGKRYDVEGADLYWLTDTATETNVKTLDPKRLDFEMMRAISHFLKEHPEGAVMIDGIENLIVENGFDDVFRFIKKINDLASVGGATIFVPLAPSSLGKDELATLQKEFDRVQILTSASGHQSGD